MGLDSVELIMDVEKHFSISIPDAVAEKAYTVGRLVDCVSKILHVARYDFARRESMFQSIKFTLQSLDNHIPDFVENDKVLASLPVSDKHLLLLLEENLQIKLPGINTKISDVNGVLPRLRNWLNFTEKIEFETIRWKKYVDIILAFNLHDLTPPIRYASKYEVYIAIMRITVDKSGVEYSEIGMEKSFTEDLGLD